MIYALNDAGQIVDPRDLEETPESHPAKPEPEPEANAAPPAAPEPVQHRPCYICGYATDQRLFYPGRYMLSVHHYCWRTWGGGL